MAAASPQGLNGSIRALFVLLNLTGGGAERVLLDLLRSLSARRFDTVLLLLKREGAYWAEVPAGLKVAHVLEPGQRFRSALPRLLKELRFRAAWADVIVGGLELDATYFALLAGMLGRKPVIGWVHTSLEPYLQGVAPRATPWVRRVYPRLAAVVCPSHGAAQSLLAVTAVAPERVHIVPNFVDFERIRQMSAASPPGWADVVFAKPTVVGMGRLIGYKGFDVLVAAHARLRAAGLDHHLLILGDGPARAELESLVKQRSVQASVFMPGFVTNPYPLLVRARAFALSSRLEGMPIVLIEAMALGVPVVAADCASGPAEVLDGGSVGILVPTEDVDALAEGISSILSDPSMAKVLAARGLERAGVYSAERVVPAWESILEAVG